MSIESIALFCFGFIAIYILGYLYTAVEFKHMADYPEEFSSESEKKGIRIPE